MKAITGNKREPGHSLQAPVRKLLSSQPGSRLVYGSKAPCWPVTVLTREEAPKGLQREPVWPGGKASGW